MLPILSLESGSGKPYSVQFVSFRCCLHSLPDDLFVHSQAFKALSLVCLLSVVCKAHFQIAFDIVWFVALRLAALPLTNDKVKS